MIVSNLSFKEKLKFLKDNTGAALIDCKKALDHEKQDLDKSLKYLKEKNKINQKNRQSRKTHEGFIFSKIINPQLAIIFTLNCETDFVARTNEFQDAGNQLLSAFESHLLKENLNPGVQVLGNLNFIPEILDPFMQKLGEKISIQEGYSIKSENNHQCITGYVHSGSQLAVLCAFKFSENPLEKPNLLKEFESLAKNIGMQIVSMNPRYISDKQIDSNFLLEEKNGFKKKLLEDEKNKNKPEAILNKILNGQIDKLCQEIVLLKQAFIKEPQVNIDTLIKNFQKTHQIQVELHQFVHLKVGKEGIVIV